MNKDLSATLLFPLLAMLFTCFSYVYAQGIPVARFVKDSAIAKIRREVSREFSEMKGVRPAVKRQGSGRNGDEHYVLTFKGKADLPGGRKISRVVRVVADERGRIIKMSTSK